MKEHDTTDPSTSPPDDGGASRETADLTKKSVGILSAISKSQETIAHTDKTKNGLLSAALINSKSISDSLSKVAGKDAGSTMISKLDDQLATVRNQLSKGNERTVGEQLEMTAALKDITAAFDGMVRTNDNSDAYDLMLQQIQTLAAETSNQSGVVAKSIKSVIGTPLGVISSSMITLLSSESPLVGMMAEQIKSRVLGLYEARKKRKAVKQQRDIALANLAAAEGIKSAIEEGKQSSTKKDTKASDMDSASTAVGDLRGSAEASAPAADDDPQKGELGSNTIDLTKGTIGQLADTISTKFAKKIQQFLPASKQTAMDQEDLQRSKHQTTTKIEKKTKKPSTGIFRLISMLMGGRLIATVVGSLASLFAVFKSFKLGAGLVKLISFMTGGGGTPAAPGTGGAPPSIPTKDSPQPTKPSKGRTPPAKKGFFSKIKSFGSAAKNVVSRGVRSAGPALSKAASIGGSALRLINPVTKVAAAGAAGYAAGSYINDKFLTNDNGEGVIGNKFADWMGYGRDGQEKKAKKQRSTALAKRGFSTSEVEKGSESSEAFKKMLRSKHSDQTNKKSVANGGVQLSTTNLERMNDQARADNQRQTNRQSSQMEAATNNIVDASNKVASTQNIKVENYQSKVRNPDTSIYRMMLAAI